MKKKIAICMLIEIFLSFLAVSSVTTKAENETNDMMLVITLKNNVVTSTFAISFSSASKILSEGATPNTGASTLFTVEEINTIRQSDYIYVITTEQNGSYGQVDYYEPPNVGGAGVTIHLSKADAINAGTMATATAAIFGLLGTVVAAATGGIAAPIVLGAFAYAGAVASYDIITVYTTDHNPDGSLDVNLEVWLDLPWYASIMINTPYNS